MNKSNEMIGKTFKTKSNGEVKVVEYNDSRNVSVEFLDTGYIVSTRASHIRNGAVKDPTRPVVCDIGFFGVGDHPSRAKGKKTLAYQTWSNMIRRCYNKDCQIRNPTYKDCSVCDEWHNYQNFAEWFEVNFIAGYQVDKDLLLYKNKIYSPDHCIFTPPWLNAFTTDCNSSRGCFPIGVHLDYRCKLFQSSCRNGKGESIYLGLFSTQEEAHEAWLSYKLTLAFTRKPEMDAIDVRIYKNVVRIIQSN